MFGPWAARMVGSNNIKPINHTLQLQLSLTKYFATLLSCPCSGGRVLEKSEGIIRPQYKHHTKSTQMQQESISGQFPSHHIEFAKAKKSSCLIYRRSNKVVGLDSLCNFEPWMMSWSFLSETTVIKRLRYHRLWYLQLTAFSTCNLRDVPSLLLSQWLTGLPDSRSGVLENAHILDKKTFWFDNLLSAACPSNTTSTPQNTSEKDKGKFCVRSVYQDGTLSLPQKEAFNLPVLRFKVWINSLCKMQKTMSLCLRTAQCLKTSGSTNIGSSIADDFLTLEL